MTNCDAIEVTVNGTWPLQCDTGEPALAVLVSQSRGNDRATVVDPRREANPEFVECSGWFLATLMVHLRAQQFTYDFEFPTLSEEQASDARSLMLALPPTELVARLWRLRQTVGPSLYPIYIWLEQREAIAGEKAAPPLTESENDGPLVRLAVLDFALDVTSSRRAAAALMNALRDCARARSSKGVQWNVARE